MCALRLSPQVRCAVKPLRPSRLWHALRRQPLPFAAVQGPPVLLKAASGALSVPPPSEDSRFPSSSTSCCIPTGKTETRPARGEVEALHVTPDNLEPRTGNRETALGGRLPNKRKYWGTLVPLQAPIIASQCQGFEAMGLEGVFAPQVGGTPFAVLGAAAASSKSLRLASGIALAFARSP